MAKNRKDNLYVDLNDKQILRREMKRSISSKFFADANQENHIEKPLDSLGQSIHVLRRGMSDHRSMRMSRSSSIGKSEGGSMGSFDQAIEKRGGKGGSGKIKSKMGSIMSLDPLKRRKSRVYEQPARGELDKLILDSFEETKKGKELEKNITKNQNQDQNQDQNQNQNQAYSEPQKEENIADHIESHEILNGDYREESTKMCNSCRTDVSLLQTQVTELNRLVRLLCMKSGIDEVDISNELKNTIDNTLTRENDISG